MNYFATVLLSMRNLLILHLRKSYDELMTNLGKA